MKTSGHTAVMASRHEALDSLDFFPTPPWATRALCTHVIPNECQGAAWEPAAGEGHMAEVLREFFPVVHASDVHDYGKGYAAGSFVGLGVDVVDTPSNVNWVITNPPFNLACEFAERALDVAHIGVALLVRTTWLESKDRYERLFSIRPPSTVALFVERVPMVKGRWDPTASTATSYAWVVWNKVARIRSSSLIWIPPGCRTRLTKAEDVARYAA